MLSDEPETMRDPSGENARAGYQIDSRWSDTVTYGAAARRSGIVAKYSIIRIICPPQARKKYGIIRYNMV